MLASHESLALEVRVVVLRERCTFKDGQNSVRKVVDTAGSVVASYDYTAFGEVLNQSQPSGWIFNHRAFGEVLDPNLGMTYLRARWMDPTTGRFESRDPASGLIGDPLSLHRYLYAAARPIDRWDPSGLNTVPELSVTTAINNLLAYIQMRGVRKTVTAMAGQGFKHLFSELGDQAVEGVLQSMGMPTYLIFLIQVGVGGFDAGDMRRLSQLRPMLAGRIQRIGGSSTLKGGTSFLRTLRSSLLREWGVADSADLASNLRRAGLDMAEGHAHHIVPGAQGATEFALRAREKLANAGVSANEAVNGVWLNPTFHNSVIHGGDGMKARYEEWIWRKLENANTSDEIVTALRDAAEEMSASQTIMQLLGQL